MEFILINDNCPEWDYIWQWLADHPINKDIPEPIIALNEGEVWHYMGSFKHNTQVIHSFRHRNHPYTKRVERVSVTASPLMNDEFILPKK